MQPHAMVPVKGSGSEGSDEEQQAIINDLDARVARAHRGAIGIRLGLDQLDKVHGNALDARLNPHQPRGEPRGDGEYQHVERIVRPRVLSGLLLGLGRLVTVP